MITDLKSHLEKYKYEILLIALIAHLYVGIILPNLDFYARVIWPLNMGILGLASVGIFKEKSQRSKVFKNMLLVLVILLPIALPVFGHIDETMSFISAIYCLFFGLIFIEILRFLISPSYINSDIISASACGIFLLIEIMVFLLQAILYSNPMAIHGIEMGKIAGVYMDLVYFASITVTTIGFGDITPGLHSTRLIVSLFGVFGQFYTVVLIGILISKFVSQNENI